MMTLGRMLLLAAAATLPAEALAIPRFAARTGADCALCHVSPSGGGARNRYGSEVFGRVDLPIRFGGGDEDGDEGDGDLGGFSGQITDWIRLGADLRAAYLYQKAERSPLGERDPAAASSFFLMQADVYATATLGSHLVLALELGARGGFEAWVLARAASEPSELDLVLRVGRFVPAFGLRDPNHDLYTRGGVGFGPNDRDTGAELTAVLGPVTASLGVVNGTFGDAQLDTTAAERRSFEKALVSRASLRLRGDWLKVHLGGSLYYNEGVETPNPLLLRSLPSGRETLATKGVDELRAGAFAMATLGRLSWVGELVMVRDVFADPGLAPLAGYASAQELAILLTQGVELSATVEFLEPDVDLLDDTALRLGGVLQVFASSHLELMAVVRRAITAAPGGGATDVLLFLHGYF